MDLDYPDYSKCAINWSEYKSELWNLFQKRRPKYCDSEEMLDLISTALDKLDDGHSYFYSRYHNDDNRIVSKPNLDPMIGRNIDEAAYLLVPREIISLEEMNDFSREIREMIIELDSQKINGWIIDLRASYGGGMWATLAGLLPFMPKGQPMGYFLTPNDEPIPWRSIIDNYCALETTYELRNPNLPIAVITGNNTCSAGEAIAIAFRGLPNAKSFGQETYGSSTSNQIFELKDGKKIALATSIMADRHLKAYGSKISPDFYQTGNYDSVFDGTLLSGTDFDPIEDEIIGAARRWIQNLAHPNLSPFFVLPSFT